MNDQSWYWTPEWQAGEREAEANRAAGRVETFASLDELLAWLARDPDRENHEEGNEPATPEEIE